MIRKLTTYVLAFIYKDLFNIPNKLNVDMNSLVYSVANGELSIMVSIVSTDMITWNSYVTGPVAFMGLWRRGQLNGGTAGIGFFVGVLFGGDCIRFCTSEEGVVWMGDAGYGITPGAADSGRFHDREQLKLVMAIGTVNRCLPVYKGEGVECIGNHHFWIWRRRLGHVCKPGLSESGIYRI